MRISENNNFPPNFCSDSCFYSPQKKITEKLFIFINPFKCREMTSFGLGTLFRVQDYKNIKFPYTVYSYQRHFKG